jgi:hypothetical protein
MGLAGKNHSNTILLKTASQRLDAAMERMEMALAAHNTKENINEAATLRSEVKKLTGINKATGKRLDGAIKRLKTVLKKV